MNVQGGRGNIFQYVSPTGVGCWSDAVVVRKGTVDSLIVDTLTATGITHQPANQSTTIRNEKQCYFSFHPKIQT